MAFPTITFKHTTTENTAYLEDLVTNKFQPLERYIGAETDFKCEVEFQKESPRHSGKLYRVEANVWLAGKMFRAEATEETFEYAIDEVRNELDKELRRAGEKRESLVRRGGRKIKEMLRRGK